jgi:hypothetical protein
MNEIDFQVKTVLLGKGDVRAERAWRILGEPIIEAMGRLARVDALGVVHHLMGGGYE